MKKTLNNLLRIGRSCYVLYGALVGGPDADDKHIDVTADWIYNEVTIDYNAAFVGACAGLYEYFGTEDMQITPDFPPAVSTENGGGGNDFWVDAYAVDDIQTSGAGVTKLAIQMRTDSTEPKTDLSMRYYFSIDEFSDKANISLVEGKELYDQASVEAGADGVISGPYQYDASFDPNIYYVEVEWDGYKVANSNKKYQFTVGFYWGDTWDPTNDWSYQGITKCIDTYQDGSETRTDYICVYSDGVLVGGIEPDGTTADIEEPTTEPIEPTEPETEPTEPTEPDTEPTEPVTTTVSTAPIDPSESTSTSTTPVVEGPTANTDSNAVANAMWGDVNADGAIDVADIVALNMFLLNPAETEMTAEGLVNANCNFDDYIDSTDSTLIMSYVGMLVEYSKLGA